MGEGGQEGITRKWSKKYPKPRSGGGTGEMANFLAAGFMKEKLADICAAAEYLRRLLSLTEVERRKLIEIHKARGRDTSYGEEVARTLDGIVQDSGVLRDFIDRLPCEPLIYTGKGSTTEVIRMLERLLAAEQRSARKRAGRTAAGDQAG